MNGMASFESVNLGSLRISHSLKLFNFERSLNVLDLHSEMKSHVVPRGVESLILFQKKCKQKTQAQTVHRMFIR